jgi:hypothetical protein
MMHEVIVSPNHAARFTKERVGDQLRTESPFVSAKEDGWQYVNPDTAVRFSLDWEPESPPRIACRLPSPRPAFFAHEAQELLHRLRGSLDVRVEETETWKQSHARTVEALKATGITLPRWSAGDAEAWWGYMRTRRALLERLDEQGVFAPQVFLFSDKRAEPRVHTAMVWCDAQATVFPVCDLVMILDKSAEPTPWGQDTRLRGFVDRAQVLSALGDHVQTVATDVGELPIFGAQATPAGRGVFRQLSVEPPPSSDQFEGISADRPIDEL